MKGLISVIVPVYNVEKYLHKCVDSILNQSYTNLEIILVEDGSPDQCGQICDQYKKIDNRVKVIHKENGGLSDARNSGLDIATGEYIAFVDSDDYIHPMAYERMQAVMIEKEADVVMCDYGYVDEVGERIHSKGAKEKEIHELDKTTVDYMELNNIEAQEIYFLEPDHRITYTVAWNKLYKSFLFENIRFPKGKIHEDEFTTFKVLYKARKTIYWKEVLNYYRVRSTSIMGEFTIKRFHIFDAYIEKMKFYEQVEKYELWKLVLPVYMHMLARYRKWAKESNIQVREEVRHVIVCYRQEYRACKDQARVKYRIRLESWIFYNLPWLYSVLWNKLRGRKS